MMSGLSRSQPPTDPYGPLYPRPLGSSRARSSSRSVSKSKPCRRSPSGPAVRPWTGWTRRCQPRGAGRRLEQQLPALVDMPEAGAAWIMIDMGRIVSGLVQFEMQAPPGPSSTSPTPKSRSPLAGVRPHAGRHALHRARRGRFLRSLRRRRLPLRLRPGALPCRAGRPDEFAVQEHLYPWREGASFECCDARLNQHLPGRRPHRAALLARTPSSTARRASSAPGSATASCTRWSTSPPTPTGGWPGTI